MTEEQKVEYFKKLHRNYQKASHNQSSSAASKSGYSSKRTPNQTQKIKSRTETGNNSQTENNETEAPGHDRVYIHRDYIPMEYHLKFKPEKDRGYGCSQCSVF